MLTEFDLHSICDYVLLLFAENTDEISAFKEFLNREVNKRESQKSGPSTSNSS